MYFVIWQRKIWNYKPQTVTDQPCVDTRLNSVCWNGISRSLGEIWKSISEFSFIVSHLIHLSFHQFFIFLELLNHLARILSRSSLKTIWRLFGKHILSKKFWNTLIPFSLRGDAVVFDEILSIPAFEKFLVSKTSEG